ncbi:unnamed protein product [Trichobilharzia regenti]|nr:unnamed protein product [Trichobilharzia regenti]
MFYLDGLTQYCCFFFYFKGLITFSIVFGLIVGQLREKGKVLLEFFSVVEDIIMRVVRLVMWFAPIGIFFLILAKIIAIKDLKKTATGLGLYMATVTVGLIIHLFIVLALLYALILRKNPYIFFKGMLQAFLTALGTASSSATLPISLKCIEDKLKIDKRVTRFVLPVGATINMDGTALYEAVASIFIAQVNDFSLSIPQIITISLTSTLAAIGAAAVPSAGLVTMIIVLKICESNSDNDNNLLSVLYDDNKNNDSKVCAGDDKNNDGCNM